MGRDWPVVQQISWTKRLSSTVGRNCPLSDLQRAEIVNQGLLKPASLLRLLELAPYSTHLGHYQRAFMECAILKSIPTIY